MHPSIPAARFSLWVWRVMPALCKERMIMNWKRIAIFTAILFLATAVAAFPFGFLSGFLKSLNKPEPTWVPTAQNIAVYVAAMIVFLILAKKQETNPWFHALAVTLLAWLISFPINVLGFGQSVLTWVFGILLLLIALVIGTPIGNYLRDRSNIGEDTA